MIDKLFAFILILIITEATNLAASAIGSYQAVSLVILALTVIYLIINIGRVILLLTNGYVFTWLILLLIWPLLTIPLAGIFDERRLALQIFYFSLFMSSIVLYEKKGWNFIRNIMIASLAVTAAGVFISLLKPELFSFAASAQKNWGDSVDFKGRAFGFYLQPNRAANAVTFIVICCMAGQRSKSIYIQLLPLLIGFAIIALTGSRGGAVVYVIVLSICLLYKSRYYNRFITQSAGLSYLRKASVPLIVCVIVIGAGLASYSAYQVRSGLSDQSLVDRFTSLFSISNESGDSLSDDMSVTSRFRVKKQAVVIIAQKPILGHGFDAMQRYKRIGKLDLSTHDMYLKTIMEYGIIYFVVYAWMITYLYFNRNRKMMSAALGSNIVTQFIACLLLSSLIINTIDTSKLYCFVLGAIVSLHMAAAQKYNSLQN